MRGLFDLWVNQAAEARRYQSPGEGHPDPQLDRCHKQEVSKKNSKIPSLPGSVFTPLLLVL